MNRSISLILVAALLVGACTSTSDDSASGTQPTTTTSTSIESTTAAPTTEAQVSTTTTAAPTTTTTTIPEAILALQPRELPPFMAVSEIPLLSDDQSYPGPDSPSSLDGLVMSPWVEELLAGNPAIAVRLVADGCVVVPGWAPLFQDAYGRFLYDNHPMFVTTDVAYHYLHLVFSKVLREGEEVVFLTILEDFVQGMVDATRAQAIDLAGTDLEDAASRAVQLMEATATLLELDVGPIGPLAQEEVDLASQALAFVPSPTTSFIKGDPEQSAANLVDYSVFKPRGHYTRNPDLQRYFRAMSLLGQGSFFLNDLQSLQVGLLTTRALVADPTLVEMWRLIYEPTAFMVGMADDYTPLELEAVASELVPTGLDDPLPFADLELVAEAGKALAGTRSVGINPEAAAVRIMGARFVIDSFVLDQLGWPNVGEEPIELRRVFVSPLDLAAAIGSDLALSVQREAEEPAYLHYEQQMKAMQQLLADRTIDDWSATVYDAWLYALQPKWIENGVAFPQFMRSEAWTAKDLMTGFGAYTELKHDTILYAKQAVLAEGGGDWIEVEPRHWVEPDPVAFRRIALVARMLRDGLATRDLLTTEQAALLDDLLAFVDRLGDIAADELAGRPISDRDNDWLEAIASTMEATWLASSDIDPTTGLPSSMDTMDALVADIARTTYFYLELGTGYIDTILVLVPNDQGRFQIAEGGVYSYYEFWRPHNEGRLTDEEWRDMLGTTWEPASAAVPDRLESVTFAHPGGGERVRPAWQGLFLAEPQ